MLSRNFLIRNLSNAIIDELKLKQIFPVRAVTLNSACFQREFYNVKIVSNSNHVNSKFTWRTLDFLPVLSVLHSTNDNWGAEIHYQQRIASEMFACGLIRRKLPRSNLLAILASETKGSSDDVVDRERADGHTCERCSNEVSFTHQLLVRSHVRTSSRDELI